MQHPAPSLLTHIAMVDKKRNAEVMKNLEGAKLTREQKEENYRLWHTEGKFVRLSGTMRGPATEDLVCGNCHRHVKKGEIVETDFVIVCAGCCDHLDAKEKNV